jgi:hypothetical protein
MLHRLHDWRGSPRFGLSKLESQGESHAGSWPARPIYPQRGGAVARWRQAMARGLTSEQAAKAVGVPRRSTQNYAPPCDGSSGARVTARGSSNFRSSRSNAPRARLGADRARHPPRQSRKGDGVVSPEKSKGAPRSSTRTVEEPIAGKSDSRRHRIVSLGRLLHRASRTERAVADRRVPSERPFACRLPPTVGDRLWGTSRRRQRPWRFHLSTPSSDRRKSKSHPSVADRTERR